MRENLGEKIVIPVRRNRQNQGDRVDSFCGRQALVRGEVEDYLEFIEEI